MVMVVPLTVMADQSLPLASQVAVCLGTATSHVPQQMVAPLCVCLVAACDVRFLDLLKETTRRKVPLPSLHSLAQRPARARRFRCPHRCT